MRQRRRRKGEREEDFGDARRSARKAGATVAAEHGCTSPRRVVCRSGSRAAESATASDPAARLAHK